MAKNMLWQNMKINKIMQTTQQPSNLHMANICTRKEGGRSAAAPLLVQVFERCRFLVLYVFCMIFVDFHTLPQHMFDHPFRNLKGWLGIIYETTQKT